MGKGLDALLPTAAPPAQGADAIQQLPVAAIQPNPHQPRREFKAAALEELAASIRNHGLVQPIIVTPAATGEGYVLVAGERRWRAAQQAGLGTVPAIVRQLDDLQQAALALVENLQREDLTPLEEAEAYLALQQTYGLTQAEIAQQVGRSRSQIANTLRLLQLDTQVQKLLRSETISRGHAKVLLSVADLGTQRRLAEEAAATGMSVRELEGKLRRLTVGGTGKPRVIKRKSRSEALDPQVAALTSRLEAALGNPVFLQEPKGKRPGRIVIEFYGDEDLERLYDQLTGGAPDGAGAGPGSSSSRGRDHG